MCQTALQSSGNSAVCVHLLKSHLSSADGRVVSSIRFSPSCVLTLPIFSHCSTNRRRPSKAMPDLIDCSYSRARSVY